LERDKKMDKKGRLGVSLISVILLGIIVLIILMTVLADTSSDMGAAAGNMSDSVYANNTCVNGNANCAGNTLPLTSFFGKKGVILLAFMAGIAIVVITAVLKFGK